MAFFVIEPWLVTSPAAAEYKKMLEDCSIEDDGSAEYKELAKYKGDGTHLTYDGIVAAGPLVEQLIIDFEADLVISDSSLMWAEAGRWTEAKKTWFMMDWLVAGAVVAPSWGNSFLGRGPGWRGFLGHLEMTVAAYCYDHGAMPTSIMLVYAGNDIHPSVDLERLQMCIQEVADFVELIVGAKLNIVDVVPDAFRG